jgi:hypothetical protein
MNVVLQVSPKGVRLLLDIFPTVRWSFAVVKPQLEAHLQADLVQLFPESQVAGRGSL